MTNARMSGASTLVGSGQVRRLPIALESHGTVSAKVARIRREGNACSKSRRVPMRSRDRDKPSAGRGQRSHRRLQPIHRAERPPERTPACRSDLASGHAHHDQRRIEHGGSVEPSRRLRPNPFSPSVNGSAFQTDPCVDTAPWQRTRAFSSIGGTATVVNDGDATASELPSRAACLPDANRKRQVGGEPDWR